MAHYQQNKFVDIVRMNYPDFFQNKQVLEIGSWDVNGNIRNKFLNCEYIGVDVTEGKGVDKIAEGQELDFPTGHFDVVISCECFEHNRYWLETFVNMIRMLKPGGLCLVTCATIVRGEHGTKRRGRDASLTSEAYNEDYYVNLDKNDFLKRINLTNSFIKFQFFTNIYFKDLYFVGIKKGIPYLDEMGKKFENISRNAHEISYENGISSRERIKKHISYQFKHLWAKLVGEKLYHNLCYLWESISNRVRGKVEMKR